MAVKGNPKGWSDLEINKYSNQYAHSEVGREKRHYKAFLKGDKFFKYKGRTYSVFDDEALRAMIDEKIKSINEEE